MGSGSEWGRYPSCLHHLCFLRPWGNSLPLSWPEFFHLQSDSNNTTLLHWATDWVVSAMKHKARGREVIISYCAQGLEMAVFVIILAINRSWVSLCICTAPFVWSFTHRFIYLCVYLFIYVFNVYRMKEEEEKRASRRKRWREEQGTALMTEEKEEEGREDKKQKKKYTWLIEPKIHALWPVRENVHWLTS